MSDKRMNDMLEELRGSYHAPPETPRDDMWAVIEAGLAGAAAPVVSMEDARRRLRPAWHRPAGWAAAAAAVLVMGVGIGRMTAPVGTTVAAAAFSSKERVVRTATAEHLGRTEALLTLVKADARGGTLDPVVGPWAATLLTGTRLLLDTPDGVDASTRELLEDLELVLIQIVVVTEAEEINGAPAGMELDLAMRGLENREVLPRIQAFLPVNSGLAGT